MRWHAFTQLILARLREFYREPEAIFWVYGFPLILAIGLGIAFAGGQPEPPTVDIQGNVSDPQVQKLLEILKADKMKVEVLGREECERRLRKGKTALFVVPGENTLDYVYDETRSDSVLARKWIDSLWFRARAEIGRA